MGFNGTAQVLVEATSVLGARWASMYKQHGSLLAVVGVALASPFVAEARESRARDQAYCSALTKTYQRYVAQSRSHPVRPEVMVSVAMADCEEGDTADAIPVLEQKLVNAKVKLPERP